MFPLKPDLLKGSTLNLSWQRKNLITLSQLLSYQTAVCEFSLWHFLLTKQISLLFKLWDNFTRWCLTHSPLSFCVSLQPIVRRKQWALMAGTLVWTALSRPPSGVPALKPVAWGCLPGSPTKTAGVNWWSRAGSVWSGLVMTSRTRRSWHSLHQRYVLHDSLVGTSWIPYSSGS